MLRKTFTQKYDEMVIQKDIGFESICEHHLLPFLGRAHIAYLPNGKIVGLSKLARVVEVLSRRPQVQERMTEELADLLMTELEPRGVGVVLEASHTCMTIRGVRKPTSLCLTSAMRGASRTTRLPARNDGFDPRLAVNNAGRILPTFGRRHDGLSLPLFSQAGQSAAPYRVHFLNVLALTGAAFVCEWHRLGGILGAAVALPLLMAFVGSIAWSLEGAPFGRTLIGLTGVTLVAALLLVSSLLGVREFSPWLPIEDRSRHCWGWPRRRC